MVPPQSCRDHLQRGPKRFKGRRNLERSTARNRDVKMLRETWGAWPWRETLSDKRRLREIQGISRNRGKSEKLWGSIIEFREILLELQRVGLRSNESPNSFSIPKSYLVQRENEKSAGREMRRSIYSLLAWKNVTFLSRIKRNREINIQFLRSGKRCKFQLSDSRCPRCPDKIVQIRVVYYFYSRKRRIFSSCFKLFPSFFFIYLFIYLLVPFRRNRRGIAAKCSQIEKILRGRKQFPRRRFEDDLYTYSGVVSVIAYTFYLSAHVPRFLRFLGGNIGWKCAGNISPRKSEKLFQQTWKTSVNNFHVSIHAERIREKSISLIYIHIVHIFRITFLSNALQTILLHFDQIRTIFQISSIQTFHSFLSNMYIYFSQLLFSTDEN